MAGRRGTGDGILARALGAAYCPGVLQGSWAGFRAVSAAYGFLYGRSKAWGTATVGAHADLGVLPALVCCLDPHLCERTGSLDGKQERIQNTTRKQVRAPLFAIFKRKYI